MSPEAFVSPFDAWDNFYVIVGSSAGALTGLQFVVMALAADVRRPGGLNEVNAFGTPTVVHFCATLLVSAILAAPWQRLTSAGATLAVCGGLGILYTLIVTNRARKTTFYRPVFEDWLFHVILPLLVYVDLLAAALVLQGSPGPALFAIAAGVLTLLFVGIHNAWDAVTFMAMKTGEDSEPPEERKS